MNCCEVKCFVKYNIMGAGSSSKTLHVMKPVELMAEFGITERDTMAFETSFNALRGKDPFITRSKWMDHWLGDETPIDPHNKSLGLRIWNAFDVDGNNKMDLAEWSLFCAISQYGSTKHKLTASFAINDKSQDGKLSKDEVLDVIDGTLRMKKRQEVRKKFLDEKGEVTNKTQCMKACRRTTLTPEEKALVAERTGKIMEVTDKDKNGYITLDEFLDAAQEHPELFEDLLI